jgi:hypothetical protein
MDICGLRIQGAVRRVFCRKVFNIVDAVFNCKIPAGSASRLNPATFLQLNSIYNSDFVSTSTSKFE